MSSVAIIVTSVPSRLTIPCHGHRNIFVGNFARGIRGPHFRAGAFGSVEEFMFEDEHGVVVANRRLQQSFGVVGSGRAGNLDPRHTVENGFHVMSVLAPRPVAPTGARITKGTVSLPPEM